ncbi:MAG: GLUG motif-containing protein, partial [Planctomycetota bacterium]
VGGLVGHSGGSITASYTTGTVSGNDCVGGLVGENDGSITSSYSTGSVSGEHRVGGLVGENGGSLTSSYSSGTVNGKYWVGGLVGYNRDSITASYSTGSVTGIEGVGGFVGDNTWGSITTCYSTGSVSGSSRVGGLVGLNGDNITSGFWDIETSGQATSDGGTGATTAEMHSLSTYLGAGWDFVDEIENGIDNIWWINEGQDYPRLWWELSISADHPDYDEWLEVGEPVCWCFSRQCHGDTDGKPQGKQQYWVSTDDLDVLIAAWNKPFSEIEGQTVNNIPLICADFDHKAQGIENYRVSTDDLDILIAHWNKANAPAADCP